MCSHVIVQFSPEGRRRAMMKGKCEPILSSSWRENNEPCTAELWLSAYDFGGSPHSRGFDGSIVMVLRCPWLNVLSSGVITSRDSIWQSLHFFASFLCLVLFRVRTTRPLACQFPRPEDKIFFRRILVQNVACRVAKLSFGLLFWHLQGRASVQAGLPCVHVCCFLDILYLLISAAIWFLDIILIKWIRGSRLVPLIFT